MGKQRGGNPVGRQASKNIGRERNWGLVCAVAAVLGIFVVVVVVGITRKTPSAAWITWTDPVGAVAAQGQRKHPDTPHREQWIEEAGA